MPSAQHDKYHEHHSSSMSAGIRQDLKNRQWALPNRVKILDGKQQGHNDEEPQACGRYTSREQPSWGIVDGSSGFFAEMGAGVVAFEGVLGH